MSTMVRLRSRSVKHPSVSVSAQRSRAARRDQPSYALRVGTRAQVTPSSWLPAAADGQLLIGTPLSVVWGW